MLDWERNCGWLVDDVDRNNGAGQDRPRGRAGQAMPLNGMVGRSRQISRESGQPFMWVDTASNNDSDNEYESHEQWSALT